MKRSSSCLGRATVELPDELLIFGIAVMGIAALATGTSPHRLFVVAKLSESIALESDAWHLRTDVYTSLGVFIGLVLIKFTISRSSTRLSLSVWLCDMKAAYDLTRRSLFDLSDHSIPEKDEKRIHRRSSASTPVSMPGSMT